MLTNVCQRWTTKRSSYRPAREPIRPAEFGVEEIATRDAKAFVLEHHYAGSFPASRLNVGLFRARPFTRSELVGCATFSVPMNQAAIPRYTGLLPNQGVELGRFVLLDDCEANAESFFLARAFRVLSARLPEVCAVLSYADPIPRKRDDGSVVCPGHVGTIYQASNGQFVGRSKARRLLLTSSGTVLSERTLSKLRGGEQGAGGAYRALLAAGAPRMRPGEDGSAYVERVVREAGLFKPVQHPGNFAYLFAIGDRGRKARARSGFLPALPYPTVTTPA